MTTKTYFSKDWLSQKPWLKEVRGKPQLAFAPSNMGQAALKCHRQSKRHGKVASSFVKGTVQTTDLYIMFHFMYILVRGVDGQL